MIYRWLLAVTIGFLLGVGALPAVQAHVEGMTAIGDTDARVTRSLDTSSPQWITQSTDPCTITCGMPFIATPVMEEHEYWRLFDLDADHGLTGQFCVESVDYAVYEAVGPTQEMTVTVYCLYDGLPFEIANLVPVGSASQPMPDVFKEFFNIEVGGCCDADSQSMAVSMSNTDCTTTGTCIYLFSGCNDLGQSGPSYYSDPAHGPFDPIDVAAIGFPDSHLIMVVHGLDEGGTGGGSGDPCGGGDGGGEIPATTGPGAALLIVILLGLGGYALRRLDPARDV